MKPRVKITFIKGKKLFQMRLKLQFAARTFFSAVKNLEILRYKVEYHFHLSMNYHPTSEVIFKYRNYPCVISMSFELPFSCVNKSTIFSFKKSNADHFAKSIGIQLNYAVRSSQISSRFKCSNITRVSKTMKITAKLLESYPQIFVKKNKQTNKQTNRHQYLFKKLF